MKRLATTLALVALVALGCAPSARAEQLSVDACINVAAEAFHVDPLPLRILRRTEAGREGLEMLNKDGSYDLGPMQINTVNLDVFTPFGISRDDLVWNRRCSNVFAAAYLFKRHLVAERGDVAMAIADYHNKNPKYASRYLELVQQAIAAERQAQLVQRGKAAPVLVATPPTP